MKPSWSIERKRTRRVLGPRSEPVVACTHNMSCGISRAVRASIGGLATHGSVAVADPFERLLRGGALAKRRSRASYRRCARGGATGERRKSECWSTPAATSGWATCISSAAVPPSRRKLSRFILPSDAVDGEDPGIAHITSVTSRSAVPTAFAAGVSRIPRSPRPQARRSTEGSRSRIAIASPR